MLWQQLFTLFLIITKILLLLHGKIALSTYIMISTEQIGYHCNPIIKYIWS